MKKLKPIIYTLLVIFILYTLYKVVLIYVLNVSSLNSHYTYHSKSVESSKDKDLFVASYRLDKIASTYSLIDSLIPKELFIEKEKIIYTQYYFYFGKSEIGNRFTMDGTIFLALSESGKYDINCPQSTLPFEDENIDKYRRNIYFFFTNKPSEITFIINSSDKKNKINTLIFKKVDK